MRIPPGWERLSDEDLALRGRADPRVAFELLFERHRGMVYGYLSRMISDRDRVDDLFQTVFLKVFRALPGFKAESRFKTWIYTIATNLVTDEIRSNGRHRPMLELTETMDVVEPPDDPSEVEDEVARVRRAVAELPDVPRELFILVRFQGLRISEAAAILGMSPAGAKMMLFRTQRRVGEMIMGQPARGKT